MSAPHASPVPRVPLHPSYGSPDGRPGSVLFFAKSRARTRASAGFVDGFRRAGLRVRWVNFGRWRRWLGRAGALAAVRGILRRERPELVFAIHPDLPAELFDAIDALRGSGRVPRIAQWCDMPMEAPSEATVASFRRSDVVFITNASRIADFAARGAVRCVPVLEGFWPVSHHRSDPRRIRSRHRHDVVYIGGPGHLPERRELLAAIARHAPVDVYGNGWDAASMAPGMRLHGPVKPPAFRSLCGGSAVVLGINRINDHPYYFSDRTVLTLACGGFHLTHRVPGLEEVFQDGAHLAWFEGVEDCVAKIRYHLADPDLRRRIAAAGHDLVHSRHRLVDRVTFILDTLEHGGFRPMLPGHLRMVGADRPATVGAGADWGAR